MPFVLAAGYEKNDRDDLSYHPHQSSPGNNCDFVSFKRDTRSSKNIRSNSCSNLPLAERNDEFPSDRSEDRCDRSESLTQGNDEFPTDCNEERSDRSKPLLKVMRNVRLIVMQKGIAASHLLKAMTNFPPIVTKNEMIAVSHLLKVMMNVLLIVMKKKLIAVNHLPKVMMSFKRVVAKAPTKASITVHLLKLKVILNPNYHFWRLLDHSIVRWRCCSTSSINILFHLTLETGLCDLRNLTSNESNSSLM